MVIPGQFPVYGVHRRPLLISEVKKIIALLIIVGLQGVNIDYKGPSWVISKPALNFLYF